MVAVSVLSSESVMFPSVQVMSVAKIASKVLYADMTEYCRFHNVA